VPLHVFDPKASAGKALVAVLDDFEQIGWFATCSQPGSRTTSAGSRRGDGQEADQKREYCNNGDRFLLSLLVCFTTEKTGDLPTGGLLHIAHLLTANGQHRVERHETDFAN
jgi:hypothetical protein